MNDIFSKALTWIKANLLLSIGIGIVIIFMFFGKTVKRLFTSAPRRRKRPAAAAATKRAVARRSTAKPVFNKDGSKKKPWQVKGSEAARRHMARIRAKR